LSGECHGHRILIPLASSVMGPEYTEEIQFFNVLLSIFFFLYTALRFMVEILNYTASQGNRKNDKIMTPISLIKTAPYNNIK